MTSNKKKSTADTAGKGSENKQSLSQRLESLNKRFDEKTKELKIFRLILTATVYFAYFLLFDMVYSFAMACIRSELVDSFNLFRNVYIPCVIMLTAFLCALPKKAQAVAFPLISVFFAVFGFAQMCVIGANGTMFRFINIALLGDGAEFAGTAFKNIPVGVWVFFALLVVVIVLIEIFIVKKGFCAENKRFGRINRLVWCVVCIGCLAAVVFYSPYGEGTLSEYSLENFTDSCLVYDSADIFAYPIKDVKAMITRKANAKANKEKIDEYFESKPEHEDNDMTGIFEGRSLIVVQLESFEKRLVTEEICPNLTELMEKSIVFENYYGMRFGGSPTLCNEAAVNLGLYMNSSFNPPTYLPGKYFPYSLANVLQSEGYTANVFHQNTAGFYDRDKVEPAFGYPKYTSYRDLTDDAAYQDDYTAAANDDIYSAITNSESDDPFLSYIITYSAHPPYYTTEQRYSQRFSEETSSRYDAVKERHPELVEKYGDTEDGSYVMLASLTDDMAGELVRRMDEDGTLENTVILFVADHANLSDLAECESNESDYIDVQNIPCFIYAEGIEPQTVEKVCSNIDLLPTLLNLFGIDEPCGYLGNDIFDTNSEGIAYTPSLSWITSKYKAVGGEVLENYTDGEIDEDYVSRMNEEVKNRIEMNELILYTEYYKDK